MSEQPLETTTPLASGPQTAFRADCEPRPPRRLVVSSGGNRPRPLGLLPRLVVHRDVEPHDVAAKLRGMLGLDPERPAPGEQAATFDRELPPLVSELDAGGWIAWCIAGLVVFGGGVPSLAAARDAAVRAVLVRVLLRVRGNISEAQRLTGTSRKVLRENMKRQSLHPWHEVLRRVQGMALPGQGGDAA